MKGEHCEHGVGNKEKDASRKNKKPVRQTVGGEAVTDLLLVLVLPLLTLAFHCLSYHKFELELSKNNILPLEEMYIL